MAITSQSVPMHWPCGPLAEARPAAKGASSPALKETLAAWANPQTLELIKETPVDCLVVPWAENPALDKEHQQALGPLLRAGRERGISFVGTIAGNQGVAGAISSGMQAGLAAFMVESLEGLPRDAPIILRTPRSGVPWESVPPVFCLTGNLWPRLGMDTPKAGDEADAGPTGVPWVNSNGWMALLAKELSRGKKCWLEYAPPETSDLDHPAGFVLAIADSSAYGSRWVVSLDDNLRRGLIQRDPRANGIWEKIVQTLRYFKGKESWSSLEPQGFLAVISDFRGDNEFLATEILNLLARRHVQYKIIERSEKLIASLRGLRAVLWVDAVEPGAAARSRLQAFVQQGGLLIAPKLWWPVKSAPKSGGLLDHFRVYSFGMGSVAVPAEGMNDPYEVAYDTHMLMSRRSDMVRVFNVTACNTLITAGSQGRTRLVQILNYGSSDMAYPASVWVRTTNRKAQLWIPGAIEPAPLRGVRSRGGWEFQLPIISTYAALEFDMRGA